jgi:hypothetical protein
MERKIVGVPALTHCGIPVWNDSGGDGAGLCSQPKLKYNREITNKEVGRKKYILICQRKTLFFSFTPATANIFRQFDQ